MMYIVISNHSAQTLVEEVNEYIVKGFTPIGGVSSVPIHGKEGHAMVQAMVNSEATVEEKKHGVDINKILVMGYEMPRMGITMDIKYEYLGNRYRFESENTDQDYTDPHRRNMAFKMLCYEDAMSRGL